MRTLITNTFFSESAAQAKSESIFATISVFIPVYGLLIATTAFHVPDIASLIFAAISLIVGISAGIIGWVRREKNLGLLVTAFVLNACLLLCLLLMFVAYVDPE